MYSLNQVCESKKEAGAGFLGIKADTLFSDSIISEAVKEKIEGFKAVQKKMESMVVAPDKKFPLRKNSYVIDYKNSLNPSQFLAATTVDGPLIIIAGAGSGKTRTLVYRMSYLLENGIPPENILLLTFTRKAATEMLERASLLLDGRFNVNGVVGSTFHSYANMMLRRHGKLMEINPRFSIMDASDSADALDLCAKELDFRVDGFNFPKKAMLQKIVSQARNWDISIVNALYKESPTLYEDFQDEFKALDQEYESFKKKRGLLDFDDLMLVFRDGLKNCEPFRKKVQGLSKYVMVDEFQDTNVVQKEIVDILVEGHRNLMVVGDDSQSIYMFRGANVENIFKMIDTYPEAKIVKIEQNYRSTKPILRFANAITDKAKIGFKKFLFSENMGDSLPVVFSSRDTESEAVKIVSSISRLIATGVPPDEIAVIARGSFHTTYIQLYLMQKNIDFLVMGGKKFVERKHVKDMLAHLKIMDNIYDEVAWHRVLELVPNIGKATSAKVVESIRKNKGRIDFSEYKSHKSYIWLHDLQVLFEGRLSKTLKEMVEDVLEHYLLLYEEISKDGDVKRKRNELEVLVKMSGNKNSLKQFLNDLTLDPPDTCNKNGEVVDRKKGKVVVSTVHSSKGLEFEYVYIPHLLEGLFPSEKSFGSMEAEEEERRVFYVACTRAKKELILSYPLCHKTTQKLLKTPSRFLLEAGENTYNKAEKVF